MYVTCFRTVLVKWLMKAFCASVLPVIQETMTSVVNQLKDIKQQIPETIGTQLQTSLVTVKQDLQRLSSDNKQGQSLGDGLKVSLSGH
jgi:hypothetical protein